MNANVKKIILILFFLFSVSIRFIHGLGYIEVGRKKKGFVYKCVNALLSTLVDLILALGIEAFKYSFKKIIPSILPVHGQSGHGPDRISMSEFEILFSTLLRAELQRMDLDGRWPVMNHAGRGPPNRADMKLGVDRNQGPQPQDPPSALSKPSPETPADQDPPSSPPNPSPETPTDQDPPSALPKPSPETPTDQDPPSAPPKSSPETPTDQDPSSAPIKPLAETPTDQDPPSTPPKPSPETPSKK